MEKEKLIEIIEKDYGFKKELIKNPEQCGLWFVKFEVNGIKYTGNVSFHGALPQLNVIGHTTKQYDEYGTPVEDWFYSEFIKDKPAKLLHCVDAEDGDWEDTGIRFENQKQAEEYMSNVDAKNFRYVMIQEGEDK